MGNDKILTTEKGFQLLNEMAQMRVNLKKIINKNKRLEKKSNQLIPKKLFKGCFNNKLEKLSKSKFLTWIRDPNSFPDLKISFR